MQQTKRKRTNKYAIEHEGVMEKPESEGSKLEYKREFNGKLCSKAVTAFTNTDGGVLMIGINDDGSAYGTDTKPDDVTNSLRNNCCPPIVVKITQETYDGKTILVVIVPIGKHGPYQSGGHYYVRDGATSRDASLVELIDLLVNGSNRGILVLKTQSISIESKIYAGMTQDPKEALLKLTELGHLINHDLDDRTAIEIVAMIGRLLQVKCSDHKVILTLFSFLPTIAVGKTFSPYEKPRSERVYDSILEIMRERLTIMSVTDNALLISALNILLAIGIACIWARHEKQLNAVLTIIDYASNHNKTLARRCKLLKDKLKKYASEEPTTQPRRMGIFFESMFDHKTLEKLTNHPI